MLLDRVPGVAKTSIAKSLRFGGLGLEFKRILFVPDILPGDIIGMSIFDQRSGRSRPGKARFSAIILLGGRDRPGVAQIESLALLEAIEESRCPSTARRRLLAAVHLRSRRQNRFRHRRDVSAAGGADHRFHVQLDIGYVEPEEHWACCA